MKLIEQLKISWPFCVVGLIFVLLIVLSTSGILTVSNFFFGITYTLLAATLTYVSIKAGRKLQEAEKYWKSVFMIYGSGILSGLWLIQAIDYFF